LTRTCRAGLSFLTAIGISLACAAYATQSVQLAWDPSPDPNVEGYVIHCGTRSGQYSRELDIGNQTGAWLTELQEGTTYFIVVTAYTADHIESDPSNELAYHVPPLPAARLQLLRSPGPNALPVLRATLEPGRQYQIQASRNLQTWVTIHIGIVGKDGIVLFHDPRAARLPRRFYRLNTVGRDIPGILRISSMASGSIGVTLSFSMKSGLPYALQASGDLKTWTTLLQGINATERWTDFIDTNSATLPRRFYRIVHP